MERLRKAADEMREEGQNGWPVTCDDAADRIEALARKYEIEHSLNLPARELQEENAALRADKERSLRGQKDALA